ncbi:MAG: copper resistance system multicopper oxidase, partial [Bacteroidales bacterium]|nr:copper resistance system multicopper oxidase [Bacteroidales bacterium]
QTGLYGAIIIDPAGADQIAADRDHVVVLSDWSDQSPESIFRTLKIQPHYYSANQRTLGDLQRELGDKGLRATWRERLMWNRMRMSDRDIADVTGHTYTFLMNGQTPAQGWLGLYRKGEVVRLRFINASAMSFFDVRIPGLAMKVVAADGQAVEPVSVDEFRIGVAETYDVLVEPDGDTAYTIFAQAMDRSGYARGTLATDPAMHALIPEMDPSPVLSHVDMGMNHGDHAVHSAPTADHGDQGHDQADPHAHHGHTAAAAPVMGSGGAGFGSASPVVHGARERGPHVDMRAEAPRYRLDDPGVGLRDHQRLYGRKVLTYGDLRNLGPTPDPREPGRELQLHLTGNMSRYMWSIDGIPFHDAEPLRFHYGERLRITLINDTMMNHPMHLHGMWSDLETGDADHIPRKHTVVVQPGAKISCLVTADAPGRWAYHCHLLYHMSGMFREVRVD